MVKVIAPKRSVKQPSRATEPPSRAYTAEEFEADTTEDRPNAILAAKRRQFLESLQGQLLESVSAKDQ